MRTMQIKMPKDATVEERLNRLTIVVELLIHKNELLHKLDVMEREKNIYTREEEYRILKEEHNEVALKLTDYLQLEERR